MQKNDELYDELAAFRQTLTVGLARINHRIDHIVGKHETVSHDECPSCAEGRERDER